MKRSRRRGAGTGHPRFRRIQRAENVTEIGAEPLACRRQRQTSGGAVDQSNAEALLEPLQPLGHHRGRQAQRPCGSAEAARFGHGDEQRIIGIEGHSFLLR